MIDSIAELSELILSRDNILILTHANPDGDTLGSGCALALALRSLGKRADVSNSEDIPEKYRFMTDLVPSIGYEPDYVISVDVADTQLLGRLNEEKFAGKIDLAIDHHEARKVVGRVSYIEPSSAACAEIIYLLVLEMGAEITKEIAACLYTGISTDTGCFKYSNTTARTHEIAAALMNSGLDISKINEEMFERKTFSFLKMQQLCLEGLELHFDGRMSLFVITRKMKNETGCGEEDYDYIIALSRQIQGVHIGVTFKEKSDGSFKVSVRTDETIDAAAFCSSFGGGGHKRAAGCSFDCGIDVAKRLFIEQAAKLFE